MPIITKDGQLSRLGARSVKRGVKPSIKQGKKEVSTTLLYNRLSFLVSKEKSELEFCLCSFHLVI